MAEEEEIIAKLDRTQLIRVITNLVKNAIQAVPEVESPRILVSVVSHGDKVKISVADNGIGIQDGFKDKVFEPKFTTKSSGMGLGLGMVKNIVETYNGSINFTSQLGKGTVFTVMFPKGVKNYLKYCQEEKENRPYTSRYIGSLVSDFHRNMIKGGIYLYPTSSIGPKGKLRLLYECNPMAFLAEQAKGKATDGYRRILDIKPTELHQRVPFFCGSMNMVEKAEEFMAAFPEDANY